MFGNKFNKIFDEMINSERYKSSKYEVHVINGKYALNIKESTKYVDLTSPRQDWRIGSEFFKDCLGSKRNVLYAFNFRNPIIKQYTISK